MKNSTLQHISKGLDEVLTDILVKCMLNPNNKDFYIGNLTLGRVKQYFVEMPKDDVTVDTVFWNAYSRAEALFEEEQPVLEECRGTCPECGCQNYVQGVTCPNCDYVEEV